VKIREKLCPVEFHCTFQLEYILTCVSLPMPGIQDTVNTNSFIDFIAISHDFQNTCDAMLIKARTESLLKFIK
jgi:hypothetical protein